MGPPPSLGDKLERCPNLNSAHTQTNLLAHQQNVDSRSLGAQSGDSSAFVFRENALSDSFLSNHPVSHKARPILPHKPDLRLHPEKADMMATATNGVTATASRLKQCVTP
jgi:hypothetical protein